MLPDFLLVCQRSIVPVAALSHPVTRCEVPCAARHGLSVPGGEEPSAARPRG